MNTQKNTIMIPEKARYFNRDISWLAFNNRVLQEALNENVPLMERLKFMAIYSNNLDEFYRVRVASIMNLTQLKKKQYEKIGFDPNKLLDEINLIVDQQQNKLGKLYREEIIPELSKEGIDVIDEWELCENYLREVFELFEANEKNTPRIVPLSLDTPPFLENKKLYFIVTTLNNDYFLCGIPTDYLPRFVTISSSKKLKKVCFIDDALRAYLRNTIEDINGIYSIKMSRDAELYIGDEYTGNLVQKIRKQVEKRDQGLPTRFLYDKKLNKKAVNFLRELFNVPKNEMIPGGKYHNFSDLFQFPTYDKEHLENKPQPALKHQELNNIPSYFDHLKRSDVLLHFPYQRYDYVIDFLDEAARDKKVKEIQISLYRVSDDSKVCQALIKALKNGIKVTAFIEMKARFDENSNYSWAKKLEKAGATVLYSIPELKVHSKVFLITRKEGSRKQLYGYFGTGNFNEKTSKIYGDIALLTCDKKMTSELEDVFAFLKDQEKVPTPKTLLVSPFSLRKKMTKLINKEAKNALKGLPAFIIIKVNNLEDESIIDTLYEASNAGVKIQLIVRGICRLIPGVKGMSENIEIISIVDRYLEHSRVFWFCNNGKDLIYSGSADMMKRNLNRRVEVVFPIHSEHLMQNIKSFILLQLADNQKARVIQHDLTDKINALSGDPIRCQEEFYQLLKTDN